MKHSARVMAFGIALTTAMVPQALAQKSHPANVGPPPLMGLPQQQTQTQQKMQAPKQQNTDSRARSAAAGAANRDVTGTAGKDAAAGGGTQNRQAPRQQGGAKR
jgi:hypothetical protein